MSNSDIDYYKIRDALLQDSSRDIRIYNWISSQYDFALSESEFDEYPKASAPSRADSPLLGYSDPSIISTATTSPASSQEAVDSDSYSCPSYDTLFFPDASQDNLSAADQEFEDRERERALTALIQDMTIWESLDTSREKVRTLSFILLHFDLRVASVRHYHLYRRVLHLARPTRPHRALVRELYPTRIHTPHLTTPSPEAAPSVSPPSPRHSKPPCPCPIPEHHRYYTSTWNLPHRPLPPCLRRPYLCAHEYLRL